MRLIDADLFKAYCLTGMSAIEGEDVSPETRAMAKEATEAFIRDIDEQPSVMPEDIQKGIRDHAVEIFLEKEYHGHTFAWWLEKLEAKIKWCEGCAVCPPDKMNPDDCEIYQSCHGVTINRDTEVAGAVVRAAKELRGMYELGVADGRRLAGDERTAD